MTRTSYFLISLVLIIGITILVFIPGIQEESYRNTINPEDFSKLEPKDRVQLQKDLALVENSFRTTLAQIIGGSLLLVSLYFTFQNVKIAQENVRIANKNLDVMEEGKITDRFSKAVELLGDEKLEVRLGGIYALGRLAHDYPKDHWTVIEVLTAFVRENSHKALAESAILEEAGPTDPNKTTDKSVTRLREDIQAIMTVFGGRNAGVETESQVLDLKFTKLAYCTLNSANLNRVNLSGADLCGARLRNVKLINANLIKANLTGAVLTRVEFDGAYLKDADFNGATFDRLDLRRADLTEAKNFGLAQLLSTSNYEGAVLSEELKQELETFLSEKSN